MLTNDDLKAIKAIVRPIEEKVDRLDVRMDRTEKKNDRQHNELQAAINRVADIHDDKIGDLFRWRGKVDQKLGVSFAV
ncbi:MAG: hypothetical protein M1484_04595 [Patescibacteria group bacterium]|nr:hypothetical protein [Patescibacteria group bacterium]MCL5432335.1 hypothetical protein [Patescibacteria group bacterium]